jgi:hypothetical protein
VAEVAERRVRLGRRGRSAPFASRSAGVAQALAS